MWLLQDISPPKALCLQWRILLVGFHKRWWASWKYLQWILWFIIRCIGFMICVCTCVTSDILTWCFGEKQPIYINLAHLIEVIHLSFFFIIAFLHALLILSAKILIINYWGVRLFIRHRTHLLLQVRHFALSWLSAGLLFYYWWNLSFVQSNAQQMARCIVHGEVTHFWVWPSQEKPLYFPMPTKHMVPPEQSLIC